MKKFYIFVTVMILSVFGYSNVFLQAQFGGGSGTEIDPYLISTKEHLQEISDLIVAFYPSNYYNRSYGKYFKLMNDITDTVRTTVGYMDNSTELQKCFQGDFNGNNKKIILSHSRYAFAALFSAIYKANIYDLTVEGYLNAVVFAGGICGYADSSNISNCMNYGSICLGEPAGGICGWADGTNITNCANYGNIFIIGSFIIGSNYNYVGGICGQINNANLLNCENYGDIIGGEAVGGITGCFFGTEDEEEQEQRLSGCTNTGKVTGVFAVGGISGHTHEGIKILDCINTGTVRADSIVGGIAGGYDNFFAAANGSISNSINSGLVVGENVVGGIIGRCWGEVTDCFNNGVVSGNTNVGCIFGEKSKTATLTNCHFDKQMCD
jgi:hypothetical protein